MNGERLQTIQEMERSLIRQHLVQSEYNVTRASDTLGITPGTVYNKIHEYGWSLKEMKTQHLLHKASLVKHWVPSELS